MIILVDFIKKLKQIFINIFLILIILVAFSNKWARKFFQVKQLSGKSWHER